MSEPLLSPEEIVSIVRDSGVIDRGTAALLEQRIVAYCESRAAQARVEGRIEGITEAIKKAQAMVNRTKGGRNRSGADKVLWYIKTLLPAEAARRLELARARNSGFRCGVQYGRQSSDAERKPRDQT
jgi:hypothetical protein